MPDSIEIAEKLIESLKDESADQFNNLSNKEFIEYINLKEVNKNDFDFSSFKRLKNLNTGSKFGAIFSSLDEGEDEWAWCQQGDKYVPTHRIY